MNPLKTTTYICQRSYSAPGYWPDSPCSCAHCTAVKEGRKAWNPKTRKWELTRAEDRQAVEDIVRDYYAAPHRLDAEIEALHNLRVESIDR